MVRIRGLELTFNLVKDQIKSKQDCVVAALHCLLINEGLECVGTGEEFSDEDASSTTELLPKQWNENQEIYTLRYISKATNNRYLIKIIKVGNLIHINIVLNEDKTAAISTSIDKLISTDFRNYSSAYNDLDSLKDAFQKDIVERVMTKPSVASASKSTDNKSTPLRVGPILFPGPRIPPYFGNVPFAGGNHPAFPDVGSLDLDPLGRGSSGMLLDPFDFGVPRLDHVPSIGPPTGLPTGSVPPGARFYPFVPPICGPNRFEPNPDHFRPPDFL